MKTSQSRTIIISSLTFLFGVILGPGALWQWSQSQKNLELERSKHISQLRHELNNLFFKTVELQRDWTQLSNDFNRLSTKYGFGRGTVVQLTDPEIREKYKEYKEKFYKRNDITSKLEFLQEDFNALEEKLAKLEDREPRELPINMSAPAPAMDMKIILKDGSD